MTIAKNYMMVWLFLHGSVPMGTHAWVWEERWSAPGKAGFLEGRDKAGIA